MYEKYCIIVTQRPFYPWTLIECLTCTMIQARYPRCASHLLSRAHHFSTTAGKAVPPIYRPSTQTSTSKIDANEVTKREQSTATATAPQTRPPPSPAFNRDDPKKWRDVQPLQPFRQQEMDHSFVGMTGGQIFHEMMLRHGVKHICTLRMCRLYVFELTPRPSWIPWRRCMKLYLFAWQLN